MAFVPSPTVSRASGGQGPFVPVGATNRDKSLPFFPFFSISLLQNRPLFQAICPGSLWARDNRWLLSRLVDPTGTKGPRTLLSRLEPPTGTKGPPFDLVGVSNRDKRPWPPYPLPSPPARAIQLTCFLLFLARERGILAHFFTTFVKIFDSPSIHRR